LVHPRGARSRLLAQDLKPIKDAAKANRVHLVYYSANRRANMDPNTMFLAAAIRASIQLAAEQDSSVPMAKRMDFKTAFRTAYKDLHLAVEIQDERPGSSRL